MKFKTLTTAILALFLVSCDKPTEIKKTHDLTDQYVDIRVMTFESRSQLNKFLELKSYSDQEVEGLARWAHPKSDMTKVNRCDIYVVEPSGVRDKGTLTTWGHELAHCMYGSYHKEGER